MELFTPAKRRISWFSATIWYVPLPHGKILRIELIPNQVGAAKGLTSASGYDHDMKSAKKAGIDAFALNIGKDGWAETQLGYAYESAANNGMSVFISFDFNRFDTSQALDVANILGNFISLPAQLKVDGKPFVSTFSGTGLDLPAVRSFVKQNKGADLFVVPNFKASNLAGADGLFNWIAWPSDGNNKAPNSTSNYPVKAGDEEYQNALGSLPYMARECPVISIIDHFLETDKSSRLAVVFNPLWIGSHIQQELGLSFR